MRTFRVPELATMEPQAEKIRDLLRAAVGAEHACCPRHYLTALTTRALAEAVALAGAGSDEARAELVPRAAMLADVVLTNEVDPRRSLAVLLLSAQQLVVSSFINTPEWPEASCIEEAEMHLSGRPLVGRS